ncbi:MAG TPA: insulinase family protein [Caulobacteraceae bacterium]|nr:insulinase family protein [Caulobacteraceae bacterium]
MALALAGVCASLAAPADLGPIAPDPDVRQGVLPNGLHYAVMRNGTPKGSVSLRFAVLAGSYEENDDELGLAHFLEHMAFAGSKNFPGGSLDSTFADMGVGFGRDQNAETSLSVTEFRLDINDSNAKKLDTAFRWTRDIADGDTLDEAAVERERGVILSEREARLSPAQSLRIAVDGFRQKGLRSPTRMPIGTVESVSTMTSARLRAFYDRWYRPENAVVVAAGDDSLDDLEKRVKDAFGSWTGKGPKPTRPPRNTPDPKRDLDVLTTSEPQLSSGISVCKLRAPDGVSLRTVKRLRWMTLRAVWKRILDERLSRLAAGDKPPFLRAAATFEGGREAAQACLLIAPLDDQWKPALEAASNELRRFALYGPTQDELDRAMAAERSVYQSANSAAGTRFTEAVATSIQNDILSGDVVASPAEKLKDFEIVSKTITPQLLRDEFAFDWSGNGPLISVVAPKAPNARTVRDAWTAIAAEPAPSAYTPPKAETWSYTNFGPPGTVVKREEIADPGFTRLTFSNGVVVNFKQTAFQKNLIIARLRFGAGRREIPNDQLTAGQFAGALFVEGGLGRFDTDTLQRLFADQSWQPSLDIETDAFELRALSTPSAFRNELQILSAYLTDPGFRPNVDARVPTAVSDAFRRIRSTPSSVFAESFRRAADPQDPSLLPPEEGLKQLKSTDFARLLKGPVTQAPLEVTVVGDIDEATVTKLVGETLGALPARKPADRARNDTRFLVFPQTLPPTVRATHEGPKEKAMVGVVWPLFEADRSKRREEYALNLAARVLSDELRHRVRQELGKTYTPQVTLQAPDRADQAYVVATVETAPGELDAVASEIVKSAQKLAATDGVTADMLERARQPLLTALDAHRQTNAWWLEAMDGSAADTQVITDATDQQRLYREITLDEVRKAAATWLRRPPLVTTVAPSPVKPPR